MQALRNGCPDQVRMTTSAGERGAQNGSRTEGQGRRHHRRQRRHRPGGGGGARARRARTSSWRARQEERLKKEARRVAKEYGVKTLAVACDVATRRGLRRARRGDAEEVQGRRHPDQQCRHRLERDDHGGARREVAGLLGPARHGGGAAGARAGALDEEARRRRRPPQRLDLRRRSRSGTSRSTTSPRRR